MKVKFNLKVLLIGIVIGAVFGSLFNFLFFKFYVLEKTEEELIKDFYLTENAVYVSPHSLRVKMDKGINDYILVDLRSREEYEKGHIVGAINIPAYEDPRNPAYEDVDRIVKAFESLPKDKEIIVYCYSIPCMSGRKIGKILAEHGIYVKHLGIGWNEWRYFWTLWNHDWEWNITNPEDYIAYGPEPGVPKARNITTDCTVC
jgi:rhodanese-related sulfurtransferase